MTKDSKQIYQLYKESTESEKPLPKFKVGDLVKIKQVILNKQKHLIGTIKKIERITPAPELTKSDPFTYWLDFNDPYSRAWKSSELELFDLKVKQEDKQTAMDLLDI